jgi:excisionase family DNA binding protein
MSRTPTRRRLATLANAAEYAGVSTRTLRRWIATGLVTGYRRGPKLVMVDLDEIDQQATKVIPTAKSGA